MNDREFENELRKAGSLPLPERWRAEILGKARRQVRAGDDGGNLSWIPLQHQLMKFLFQHRFSATALAGLWLVILSFQMGQPLNSDSAMAMSKVPFDPHLIPTNLQTEIQLVEATTENKSYSETP